MKREEITTAIEWAAAEGWNPGLHDADCYYKADPNGFLIGLLNDEPIATISVVKYDNSFGFLGFYIVKPEYRGQGYGIQIWNAGLDYLKGCTIGLDGVVDQQENYKKSEFFLAYRNIRYEGVGSGAAPDNPNIVELSTLPFEIIDFYDKPFFPANRSEFTKAWISQPESHALGIMQKDQLAGYGVIRPCRTGYKMGPLFADTAEDAELLFTALRAKVKPDEPVFFDLPEINEAAVTLAEKNQMTVSFETARMYLGNTPTLPLNRIFGVTSFEIG